MEEVQINRVNNSRSEICPQWKMEKVMCAVAGLKICWNLLFKGFRLRIQVDLCLVCTMLLMWVGYKDRVGIPTSQMLHILDARTTVHMTSPKYFRHGTAVNAEDSKNDLNRLFMVHLYWFIFHFTTTWIKFKCLFDLELRTRLSCPS